MASTGIVNRQTAKKDFTAFITADSWKPIANKNQVDPSTYMLLLRNEKWQTLKKF